MMSRFSASSGARARDRKYPVGLFRLRVEMCPNESSTRSRAKMWLAVTKTPRSALATLVASRDFSLDGFFSFTRRAFMTGRGRAISRTSSGKRLPRHTICISGRSRIYRLIDVARALSGMPSTATGRPWDAIARSSPVVVRRRAAEPAKV